MVKNYKNVRVLVIGDIMADRYIYGNTTKLSFEAPIPIVEVNGSELKTGGASVVMENASLLGAKVFGIGIIGMDEVGGFVKKRLQKSRISQGLIISKSWHTPIRTRVLAEKHQVSRFDDAPQNLSQGLERKIIQNIYTLSVKVDCIVVCDYGKGTMTKNVVNAINKIAIKDKKILVSPVVNHLKYTNPNFIYRIKLKDAGEILDTNIEEQPFESICKKMQSLVKSKKIILTRGEHGLTAYEDGISHDISATQHVARDITSVGEILLAAFAVAYGSGISFNEACTIGNIAAGAVVEKYGSKHIERKELEKAVREYHEFGLQK